MSPPAPLATTLKLGSQLLVIIDLAVEDDDIPPTGSMHRLCSRRREFDDRQPAVSEGHLGSGVQPIPFGIWTAMHDRVGHRLQDPLRGLAAQCGKFQETHQSTHRYSVSFLRPETLS